MTEDTPLDLADDARRAWIRESNALARPLLEFEAHERPELLTSLGYEGVNEEVSRLAADQEPRQAAACRELRRPLAEHLAHETRPHMRLDLELMIEALDLEAENLALEAAMLVSCPNPGQIIYGGVSALLADPAGPRLEAVRVRLLRYAGLAGQGPPLLCQAETALRAGLGDADRLAPRRLEVEYVLSQGATLLPAALEAAAVAGVVGIQPAAAALRRQLDDFHSFLRCHVLPRSCPRPTLPRAIYALRLQRCGIAAAPDELVRQGQAQWRQSCQSLKALARQLGGEGADWRQLLRQQPPVPPNELQEHYRQRQEQLLEIIQEERLVTPPALDLRFELLSGASAAVQPNPHLGMPRLLASRPGPALVALPATAEVSSAAMSWTLTAHEALPGHAAQLHGALERGLPLARSYFGYRAAAIEGWAAYMEAELRPSLPLVAQLAALQRQLLIAARAVLEPLLHFGRISQARAQQVLATEVGLSKASTRLELERYTLLCPGQAPAYLAGCHRLYQERLEAEQDPEQIFDACAFHDQLWQRGPIAPPRNGERIAGSASDEATERHAA